MNFVLHNAPDNASLIIRLALLELEVPFETRLIDRRIKEQSSEAFLKLNVKRPIFDVAILAVNYAAPHLENAVLSRNMS